MDIIDIIQCPSCEGYGWQGDETGEPEYCDWCGGVGYVYLDMNGINHPIPQADWEAVGARLEQLEAERLRRMGYTGEAKKPWEQAVRRGDSQG